MQRVMYTDHYNHDYRRPRPEVGGGPAVLLVALRILAFAGIGTLGIYLYDSFLQHRYGAGSVGAALG